MQHWPEREGSELDSHFSENNIVSSALARIESIREAAWPSGSDPPSYCYLDLFSQLPKEPLTLFSVA